MKFWFYDFIDEMAETISKMWEKHKKKKNPKYKATEELKNRIRWMIRIFLIVALVGSITYLLLQVKTSFMQ